MWSSFFPGSEDVVTELRSFDMLVSWNHHRTYTSVLSRVKWATQPWRAGFFSSAELATLLGQQNALFLVGAEAGAYP